MEGERLKAYRRWYKELDARKAQLEVEGVEDPRALKLLEGELRCLEELITLDSQLLLLLPDTVGRDAPGSGELGLKVRFPVASKRGPAQLCGEVFP